jgi:hypothetical protein
MRSAGDVTRTPAHLYGQLPGSGAWPRAAGAVVQGGTLRAEVVLGKLGLAVSRRIEARAAALSWDQAVFCCKIRRFA